MTEPLTLAQQVQLECDLRDLPDLWDLLIRHEDELLGQGEGSTLDRVWRTPADLDVVDLTDTRYKLTDGRCNDLPDDAHLDQMAGARRLGVLPKLQSWVGFVAGEMADHDEPLRIEPTDPAAVRWVATTTEIIGRFTGWQPTVASECRWLAVHADWIEAQAWVVELATDLRTLTADLAALVGDGVTWDESTMHAEALAAHLGMSASGIRMWVARGYLAPVGRDGKRHLYSVRDAEQVKRSTTPAAKKRGQDARIGSVAWWR